MKADSHGLRGRMVNGKLVWEEMTPAEAAESQAAFLRAFNPETMQLRALEARLPPQPAPNRPRHGEPDGRAENP